MTYLTSSSPSWHPRLLHLFASTAFPCRALRISHVHCITLMTCRAFRPRGCPTPLPKTRCRVVSSGQIKPLTIPPCTLTGLYHFSPNAYGLSPLCLRLTGVVTHTGPRLDIGCGGSPLPELALSAASNTAPRGAQFVSTRRPIRSAAPTYSIRHRPSSLRNCCAVDMHKL